MEILKTGVKMEKIKTGAIVPLGDGSVGKSALTRILFAMLENRELSESEIDQILSSTHKSTNIEFEFLTDYGVDRHGDRIKCSMQYYIFPGQVQKESSRTVTFNEILNIFDFLPALKNCQVILLVYDITRFYTLQSLESWLTVAIEKGWVDNRSLILLVANKSDIARPPEEYAIQLTDGIYNLMTSHNIDIPKEQIHALNTSCKSLENINQLHQAIVDHIANYER